MSTREELQAEHVAQITEQLRSRGGGVRMGRGVQTLEGCWRGTGDGTGWGGLSEELRSVWFRRECFYSSLDKYMSNHFNLSD